MQTIIMTSDKYLNALRPFMWLWDKYFQPDFEQDNVICGFAKPDFPLSPNFRFYSTGDMKDYPIAGWSNQFIDVLDNVADEVFMFMLEDYWLIRETNTKAISVLYDYMLQFQYVVKMDLYSDRLYAQSVDLNYGIVSFIDLIKSMPGSPYHMSLMCGLWNRDLMRNIIIPDETPWQIEIDGTHRLSFDFPDMLVLGTRQLPLKHTLAFRGGDSTKLLLDEMQVQDVKEMRELGLLEGLE